MENEIVTTGTSSAQLNLVDVNSLPKSGSLTREDLLKWGKNTLLFTSPALIALLTAYQSGTDLHLAVGMAVQAVIASAIDLLVKFSKGV